MGGALSLFVSRVSAQAELYDALNTAAHRSGLEWFLIELNPFSARRSSSVCGLCGLCVVYRIVRAGFICLAKCRGDRMV